MGADGSRLRLLIYLNMSMLDLGNASGGDHMSENISNDILNIETSDEEVIKNKQLKDYLIPFIAFLFVLTAFILSFFNIVQGEVLLDESEIIITGAQYMFGEYINAFGVMLFVTSLISVVFAGISVFYKKVFTGIASLFSIISSVLLFCTPSIIETLNGDSIGSVELAVTGVFSSVFFVIGTLVIFIVLLRNIKFTTYEICELGILIAAAICLDFAKIRIGQTGGSINFQIIPLAIIALRHTPMKTFISAGIIYGLISCLLDGYALYTFPLEYMVAFGSVMIISLLRKQIMGKGKFNVIGLVLLSAAIILQTGVRFFAASIDSVLFYEIDWVGAFAYNALYVLPTGALTLVVVGLLYIKPLFMLNKISAGE